MAFDYQEAIKKGYQYNLMVAEKLISRGVPNVIVPPFEQWDGVSKEIITREEKDVLVGDLVLEVKCRSLRFNGLSDFPYEKIIVDTVYGYDAKAIKPFAYVVVSEFTKECFVIPGGNFKFWTIASVYDNARQTTDDCYFVERRFCSLWIELVDVLLEQSGTDVDWAWQNKMHEEWLKDHPDEESPGWLSI
jgi:hypothetical protein